MLDTTVMGKARPGKGMALLRVLMVFWLCPKALQLDLSGFLNCVLPYLVKKYPCEVYTVEDIWRAHKAVQNERLKREHRAA